MSRYLLILLAIASVGAAGCNQGDERLEEKARLEGRAQALAELQAQLENLEGLQERARAEGRAQAEAELQVQIENMQQLVERARQEGRAQAEAEIVAQNRNLAERAAGMEADLNSRHNFFGAVEGTYEGTMQAGNMTFSIRMTLVPNISRPAATRTRTLEEITYDLTNLSFNAQVLQWNPRNVLSAVGCRVQGVRPDMASGVLHIASQDCPNFYAIRLSSGQPGVAGGSDVVAREAREGRMDRVPEVVGEVHPTTNAAIYRFRAVRQ
mgnify:CR=1 FL=1